MSLYLDTKYINVLGQRLEKFKWKSNRMAICRCPICGDSQKNKNKCRFYFYEHDNSYMVKCHNCGYSKSFFWFLKEYDEMAFKDYSVDEIKQRIGSEVKPKEEIIVPEPVHFMERLDLPAIGTLSDDHPAKEYLIRRQIPEKFFNDLYYADDFSVIAKEFRPGVYVKEARIVIPLRTKTKEIFGIQGRSLAPKTALRYLTLKSDGWRHLPKIYGLDRVDESKRIYCLEGPFDSMFVENAIAMSGASISLPTNFLNTDNMVFVFDNEPRNLELHKQMQNVIRANRKICIWPNNIKSKDINDMVLNNELSISQISAFIDEYTFSGLEAWLKMSSWSKI